VIESIKMNERIKELRRQATLVETYTTNDGTVAEGKSVDLEKFAELIVEECIFAIDEQCSNSDAEGTIEAITILQKHFQS
jgi:hypothetical protein